MSVNVSELKSSVKHQVQGYFVKNVGLNYEMPEKFNRVNLSLIFTLPILSLSNLVFHIACIFP